MPLGPRPYLKICCIESLGEAGLAMGAGAQALGLVSAMPSGPGVIDETAIAVIAAAVPPPVATFLLTASQTAEAIIAQHRRCRTSVLQLVDRLPAADLERLRSELPGVRIVQVIHVFGEASLREAEEVAPRVDALLLDSGNPTLAVKELGGTGRTHDWNLSRRIRESVDRPIFLAGGLHAGNVAAAVAAVEPLGIDVCSGVRSQGHLDPRKLEAFAAALWGP